MNHLLPILPVCQHRGRDLGSWCYECRSTRIRHRTDGVALHETCVACPFADEPNEAPVDGAAWRDCRHRGIELRQQRGDLCGRRGEMFPVFRCELHGECTLTRFCAKQPGRLCYACEDAEAVADHLVGNVPPQA